MRKTSLNDLYMDYSSGLLKRKEFEGTIFKNIKEKLKCPPGWDADDYNDYVSWLYPRICSAINNYQDTGANFETYIWSMIRMTIKEYRLTQAENNLAESAAWMTQVPDSYVCEPEPHYGSNGIINNIIDNSFVLPKIRNRRQMLILILKCCAHVSDDFLERISPNLRMEPEILKEMIKILRAKQKNREMYINDLREKINNQFFRCSLYERKLEKMPKESIGAQRLASLMERGKNRLASMRKRLSMAHAGPSNRQIAELLGITKGAVDSSLCNIKTWFKTQDSKNEDKT